MAAMLLGHWYLNSPTMELGPLRRLILAMAAALGLQVVVSSLGLWGELSSVSAVSTQWVLFVVLRWLFGLVGVAGLTWMAWQTLKIPNTQSTTGILYVAVIGTFVGETMALLLSRESLFPL
jgi:FtsH-binding integral membrane protein